jgi:L-asparaginase / beta-aspartyl-peptidase
MTTSSNEKIPLLTISSKMGRYVLVIHGGAGTMSRNKSTPEKVSQYKHILSVALRAGYDILSNGGEAMDAAVAAVSVMEGLVLAISHALPGHSDCDP